MSTFNAHDFLRPVDEVVPRLAAKGDDAVIGFEDAVREPVIADILPDIFYGVQFW